MRRLLIPLAATPLCLWSAKVQENYEQYCLTCHGENLEGGLGTNLITGPWKHGTDDSSIYKQIAEGNLEMGMPGYAEVLSDEEIRALVIYIKEKQQAYVRSGAEKKAPALKEQQSSQYHDFKVETLIEGLESPWSMAMLPDGRWLIAEKKQCKLLIAKDGKLTGKHVQDLEGATSMRQGGMMEVALHPDYTNNGWIYLGYCHEETVDGDKVYMTRVVRGRLQGDRWVDEEILWQTDRSFYNGRGVHYGVRFVFHEGYLFFGIGDRGRQEQAQDLSRPNGKIHRIHDDGRIPKDNPFTNNPDALPTIWSYGHRNPQGLNMHPETLALWDNEHGPRGGDELNHVLPGHNYGWPEVTFGMNYNGTPITARTSAPEFTDSKIHWTPSIAPCGMDFYTGSDFPEWKNDLFISSLKFGQVHRIRLSDQHEVVEEEIVLRGAERVRDIHMGSDGYLYLLLEKPGRIVRLVK